MKDKEYYVCKHCETEREDGEFCGCESAIIERFEQFVAYTTEVTETFGTFISIIDRMATMIQQMAAMIHELSDDGIIDPNEANDETKDV